MKRVISAACVAASLTACQVAPPDTPAEISRATGIDNAIVFRVAPDSLDDTSLDGPLMLGLAIRMALAHDPRIQTALAHVRAAEADANQARLLPNPILNIDFRIPDGPGINNAFEATLTGDLVSLLQKPAQISAAEARLRAASQEALTTALDVMGEVQQAYVAVQSDDARIASGQKRSDIFRRLHDLVQRRFEAGDATRLEVLTIDAQAGDAELDLAELRRQGFEDRLHLAKLIGQPRSRAQWTVADWNLPADSQIAPEAAWIDAALKSRPEVHSKLYELSALGDDLTAAAFSPFVGGDIGVHTERDPIARTGPTFTVPLPLFDFGQASRAKIEANRIAARHDLAGLQADIITEVRLAYANYLYSRQALQEVRDRLRPLQAQQLDLARREYEAGDTDLPTLLIVQSDAQLREAKILDLQEKATVARIKLQRAAGGAGVADSLQSQATTAPATGPATAPAIAVPTNSEHSQGPQTGTRQ